MAQILARPTLDPGSHILMYEADWTTYTHFLKLFAESRTAIDQREIPSADAFGLPLNVISAVHIISA